MSFVKNLIKTNTKSFVENIAKAQGGGAFSPNSISDLHMDMNPWSDANYTLVGSEVSQWDDEKNGFTFLPDTDRPTLISSGVNGLDTIKFTDNSTCKMECSESGVGDWTDDDSTIIVLGKKPTGGFLKYGLFHVGGAGSFATAYRTRYDSGSPARFSSRMGDLVDVNFVNDANWHYYVIRNEGAVSTVYVDTTTTGTGTYTTGQAKVKATLGISDFDNRAGWEIGRLLVYKKAVSNSELNELGSFLETNTGVTWTDF